ncbi:hypothetical protein [Actinomadura atramentaria]|uniref:hypothetical protein n=1 Tax=Actinomadura atramentaria TaxID=1990 RepID=UPI0003A10033|nr:hypothetical protein [Actinomadura atramentaria]
MPLPQPGDYGWARPLNDYIEMVENKADAAGDGLNDHLTANDPHGTKLWAEQEFKRRFGYKIHVEDTEPTTANDGDLWVTASPSTRGIYKRVSGAWVKVASEIGDLDKRLLAVESLVGPLSADVGDLKRRKIHDRWVGNGIAKQPKFNVTSRWVDFSQAEFPHMTIAVPQPGTLQIKFKLNATNTNTDNSVVGLAYRSPQLDHGSGTGAVYSRVGSHTNITYKWVPKAGNIQIIPQWYISSGNAKTCSIGSASFDFMIIYK